MDTRPSDRPSMDARTTSRPVSLMHRVYTRSASLAAMIPEVPPRHLPMLVAQAVWLGLAGAWLEVGVIQGHRVLVGTVTRVSVWFHTYQVPFCLVAHLAIFAVWLGLAAVVSGRHRHRHRSERVMTLLGVFLAFLSPLLALEELHWLSRGIVAAGLTAKLGPWWLRHREGMLRRTLRPLGAASVLLGGFSFAWTYTAEARSLATLPPATPGAPNVVLVVLDTVRADHLSLYGYHRRTTPQLEALAGRSVCFDFARAAAPWTLPSHATMFTGRWPHELTVDTDRPLDATYPTLAEFLSRHGYLTGGFAGNTFYCNKWFGIARGFARYEDTHESQTISAQQVLRCSTLGQDLMPLAVRAGLWPTPGRFSSRKTARQINHDALAWLDRRGDRPFFLFLNYIDAHGPYIIPEGFPHEFSRESSHEVIKANRLARHKGNDARVPAAERRTAVAELNRVGLDAYDDCIRYVDEQIGQLVAELECRDLDSNTWIIITADHGEHFGEHGKHWHGNSLYRPLIDVPLVIVPPSGQLEARRVSAPVSLRNLAATIADLAGLASSSPFPGQSLRRHWDNTPGAAPIADDVPLSELKLSADGPDVQGLSPADRFRSAVVERDWIYHQNPLGQDELYVSDREEASDLAARPELAPLLEQFRARDEQVRRGDR